MLTRLPRSDAHPWAKQSDQENSDPSAQASIRWGEHKAVIARVPYERIHVLDVSHRVGVGDDHIVDVGRHLFSSLDNIVRNLGESPC